MTYENTNVKDTIKKNKKEVTRYMKSSKTSAIIY